MSTSTTRSSLPLRGSWRSRCAARTTALTLRPIASRLPYDRGGVKMARVLVEVAMRASGGVARGTTITAVDHENIVGEWVDATRNNSHEVSGTDAGVILYLHGSAFAICSARTHRGLASRLSRETNLPVFVVDYRLAPEHPFPSAADDIERAYRWLLEQGYQSGNIVVAGDSAGGHLALDLVIDNARRSVPQPAAVVLFSPLIDLTFELAEGRERTQRDPMISAASARALTGLYTHGQQSDIPRLRLAVEAGTVLPPFMVQAGGAEMLVADAEYLRTLVEANGSTCELEIWPDQMHVFQALPRISPEAASALRRTSQFIHAQLHGTSSDSSKQSAS
ncbi:alpha/beta hydrolase [Rhodococcus sp. G-MC3]|uniref:alpha/beta hydrolase n=1 Tax=Rhodococcus sp. G-MC3 TaxID=3046209 RepID=UPI0024BB3C3E|nr:alpha/beta hydrolase [Rhodococcus sp. G-MC3]MDJ0392461.1 alpha/beta hydrolase [Rhodococcus sp. G-MC3]